LRHCSGRDSGASAMGTLNEGGSFGSGICRVGKGGHCCRVTICDGAVGDQKGGYGTPPTGGGTAGWRRSRILSPPRDAAQGDQLKTTVNGNNYGSGRALDDEFVDNDDNGPGGGGLTLMIENKDSRAGVATGGDDEGNRLRSRLICEDNIGRGAGTRHSIYSECMVTYLSQRITISFRFRVKYSLYRV
jgi:hypothetical protein